MMSWRQMLIFFHNLASSQLLCRLLPPQNPFEVDVFHLQSDENTDTYNQKNAEYLIQLSDGPEIGQLLVCSAYSHGSICVILLSCVLLRLEFI